MARKLERLTALTVSRAKTRGYLADGGGLYLQISASGAKSWVFTEAYEWIHSASAQEELDSICLEARMRRYVDRDGPKAA